MNLFWTCYTPVTKNRPTLEAADGSDGAMVVLDTWKRPILVVWPAEREAAPSVSPESLGKGDDLWSVFSGLEGEEEDEVEEKEDLEDGVRDEEETTLGGFGTLLGSSSGGTEVCATEKNHEVLGSSAVEDQFNKINFEKWLKLTSSLSSVKPAAGSWTPSPGCIVSELRALLSWASKLSWSCCDWIHAHTEKTSTFKNTPHAPNNHEKSKLWKPSNTSVDLSSEPR